MERIVSVNLCIPLLFAIIFIGVVLPLAYSFDTTIDVNNKDNSDQPNSLWFGPRLGRKKRNYHSSSDLVRNPEMSKEEIATLMDILQDSPWAIFAVNEGKRHTINFTPRLGRDSGEENLGNIGNVDQFPDVTSELIYQRSPPFAPRLGRRISPYSPRLGRDNDKNSIS